MVTLRSIFRAIGRTLIPRHSKPVRRRTFGDRGLHIEKSEPRILLSGNVVAGVKQGSLKVTGDSQSNNIEILTTDEGVVVRGLDGTTVNGKSNDVVLIAGADSIPKSLVINLNGGNDRVQIDEVDIGGRLLIFGGTGNDEIGVTSLSIQGGASVFGWLGNDTVVMNNVMSEGSVHIDSGFGDNLTAINESQFGSRLFVAGWWGENDVAVQSSSVDRKTTVWTGFGDDNLLLKDSTLGRRLNVSTGWGDDLVQIENSSVSRKTRIFGWSGDDAVNVTGTSSLGEKFSVIGGFGTDSVETGPDVKPTDPKLYMVENSTVDPALIDERLNDPTTGLLPKVDTALAQFPTGDPLFSAAFASAVIESNGAVIVNNETLQFQVTGTAGLVIEIDRDGDNAYDDGTVTLDAAGMGLLETTLLHNDTNHGLNELKIRGVDDGTPLNSAPQEFDVHYAVGTVVRYTTDLGTFDVELLDADAPDTVQNFLNYDVRYDGSIVHRSARTGGGDDFIVQGGAFDLLPPLQDVVTDAPVTNEFDSDNSNLRGTLSMALPLGQPNAGTSQWFFNVADNGFLDAGSHTVFGRVIGDGMVVVDAIHDLQTVNLVGPVDEGALGEVPLENYTPFTDQVTGTVNTVLGSVVVTGTGTQFQTELRIGAAIEIAGVSYVIDQIVSDTVLTLTTIAQSTVSNTDAFINVAPDDADFVQLDIDVLLTP